MATSQSRVPTSWKAIFINQMNTVKMCQSVWTKVIVISIVIHYILLED